ncbi:phosphotransferase [Mesorhizobium sp. A556]
MQPDEAFHAVLAHAGCLQAVLSPPLPGVVSPVHRAVENHCCVATMAGRQPLFVKRLHEDMQDFVTFDHAEEASRKAGDIGIAPRLFHADAANGVLVFEALGDEWRGGSMDVLRRPQVLEKLLAAKRTFHAVAPLAETRSVFDLIEAYRRIAQVSGVALPAPVRVTSVAVERVAAAIAATGIDAVPCHADGVSSNVMVGPKDEVRLVDFEWARQADLAHDLGTVLAELLPFDGEALLAIEIATGTPDARVFARARLYGAADDLMWALWGFISAARSARKQVEFFKYAEWRLLRARTILEGPSFQTWLTRV